MADTERNFRYTDKSQVQGTATAQFAAPLEYSSVATMRTRLAAINGGYYTTTRLNAMGRNDMVYALRLNDDPTTI